MVGDYSNSQIQGAIKSQRKSLRLRQRSMLRKKSTEIIYGTQSNITEDTANYLNDGKAISEI